MKFLENTYGFDLLSLFFLILASIFNFNKYGKFITLILLFIIIFRAFSKNTYKRTSELKKFINILNKILSRFNKHMPYIPNISLNNFSNILLKSHSIFSQKRKYKIVKCKKCGQKLRVPRIHKKIIVTCKKCGFEFSMKA